MKKDKEYPMYTVWVSMLYRCNPKNKDKVSCKNYAGRGITICDEWKNFYKFNSWVEQNGYKKGLSIDRINNDGNYEPDNCRFATSLEQAANRRKPKYKERKKVEYKPLVPNEDRIKVFEVCRDRRRSAGISQPNLAKLVSSNTASIVTFEAGTTGINSHTLDRILEALEINLI